jgi:hypothetical protein
MVGEQTKTKKGKKPETLASKAAKGPSPLASAPVVLTRRQRKKKKTPPTKNDPIRKMSLLGPKPMKTSFSAWSITSPMPRVLAWMSGKKDLPASSKRMRPVVERNAFAVSSTGRRKIYINNHPFKK